MCGYAIYPILIKQKDMQSQKDMARDCYENTCSWLIRHKQLPIELTRTIAAYLRPPPFIILQKGDLHMCLSI